MKKNIFVLLCTALLALYGCKEKEQPVTAPISEVKTETESEPEVSEEVQSEPEEVPDVSPIAKEHFLEPFDDYSWEREFPIEKVIVHFMSAVVNYPEDPYSMNLLRNIFVDSGLSVHYIIARDGTVYCYMPESRAAWHAGKGTYGGEEKYTNSMNKYSVGIELAAIGSENDMVQYMDSQKYNSLDKSLIGFTDAQYESLSALVKDICERNDIEFTRENVIGHEEYNPEKSDPGELFDWSRLFGN